MSFVNLSKINQCTYVVNKKATCRGVNDNNNKCTPCIYNIRRQAPVSFDKKKDH